MPSWIFSKTLETSKEESDVLTGRINLLENKVTDLRRNGEKGSNVFDEIRLKSLLNDLKDDLEKSSDLQHQQDDKEKEFEQKALSLIALYNDRIENELQSGGDSAGSASLQLKLNTLGVLIQNRNQLQILLKKYQKKSSDTEPFSIISLNSLKTNDRESLQLTLDLIRDRKRNLEDQLEKWSIEEEEVKNELKLQGKMQDFLDGIRRLNEDSALPSGNFKKSGLGTEAGDNQRAKQERPLNEIHASNARGQASLAQINQFMVKIQSQETTSGEGTSK